jgi:ribosomal protein L16 Arg81 hydroxylase
MTMTRLEFFTTDLDGITLVNPGEPERRRILESVTMESGSDFPEVYLSLEKGPVISYRAGGCLLWEENGEVRQFINGVTVEAALKAWNQLASGNLAALNDLPWESADA